MFTYEEKMQLFGRLPALELSYEPKLHKKVHSALYYIIPKGPKALVWYTYWGEENVCLLISLNENGNYSDIRIFKSVFSDALALGTVIYGTHFIHQSKPYFTSEQLYYYKGVNVQKNKNYLERLSLLLEMFQLHHVEQLAYTNDSLVIGLPVITDSYEEAETLLNQLPYRTYGIGVPKCIDAVVSNAFSLRRGSAPLTPSGFASARGSATSYASPLTPRGYPPLTPLESKLTPSFESKPQSKSFAKDTHLRKTIFKVKAELTADTYSLYSLADNKYVGTAMVPTYKCSVMLNSLFRSIKENANLDLLEESDDESEFENTNLDKFVDLEKTIQMECVFSKKFQKWEIVKGQNEIGHKMKLVL